MAKPRMDLSAFVGKLLEEQDGDVLREGIRVLSQALMETEVAGLIGADRHERSGDRTAYRNGYRTRTWDTASPHVALKPHSALDRRTTRHAGYAISQRARKRIEEVFGWMKTVGGLRKLHHRGGARVNWQFLFAAAAYNLVRLRTFPSRRSVHRPMLKQQRTIWTLPVSNP